SATLTRSPMRSPASSPPTARCGSSSVTATRKAKMPSSSAAKRAPAVARTQATFRAVASGETSAGSQPPSAVVRKLRATTSASRRGEAGARGPRAADDERGVGPLHRLRVEVEVADGVVGAREAEGAVAEAAFDDLDRLTQAADADAGALQRDAGRVVV